jgi:hypothetical protein
MTASKKDELGELRAEMAELRALLKVSLQRRSKRVRVIEPAAPPEPSERRRQIRAKVLGKLGMGKK